MALELLHAVGTLCQWVHQGHWHISFLVLPNEKGFVKSACFRVESGVCFCAGNLRKEDRKRNANMPRRKKPKGKPRGKPFAGKTDPRSATNPDRPKPEEPVVDWSLYAKPLDDGCSLQLWLMRHVLANPKEYDRTHAEKSMRRIFEGGPRKFGERLEIMEREHRGLIAGQASVGIGPTGEPVPMVAVRDMGSERVEQLIGELFDKFEKSERELEAKRE